MSESNCSTPAVLARSCVAALRSDTFVITRKSCARRRVAMPRPIWPIERTATVAWGDVMANTGYGNGNSVSLRATNPTWRLDEGYGGVYVLSYVLAGGAVALTRGG